MAAPEAPRRFERPSALGLTLTVATAAFLLACFQGAQLSPERFVAGLPRVADLLSRMFPPDLERLPSILWRLLETLQMAVAATVIGVFLSLPLAFLAARRLSPHPIALYLSRGLVSLFRTVPDLIWALLFVITVGLGPFAGTLALIVDTIGYCGRFFAEAMEEVDPAPEEALRAMGASRLSVFVAAVVPAAMPSFVASALFALERAVRGSVVLGLVGAGGIGIELKVAMDMFQYDEAVTIIAAIFLLVLLVELLSSHARKRMIR